MICQHFVVVFASASAFCFDFGFQTYLREVWSLLEGVSAGLGPGPSSLGSQSLPALFICVMVGTSIFLLIALSHLKQVSGESDIKLYTFILPYMRGKRQTP